MNIGSGAGLVNWPWSGLSPGSMQVAVPPEPT